MVSINLILYSWIAGIAVLLGGLLAHSVVAHVRSGVIKQYIIHAFLALGSGILLSAVALVLIPRGMQDLKLLPLLVSFIAGLIVFSLLDQYLSNKGGKVGTLLAMLMDFVPEAIALGALFAVDNQLAILLAVFIGMQNIPEAFSAYLDLLASNLKPKFILTVFFLLSFVGIIAAIIGKIFLSDAPLFTAALMVFASGGILYILFNDLAPVIKYKKSMLPAQFAALGFMIGMIGGKVI